MKTKKPLEERIGEIRTAARLGHINQDKSDMAQKAISVIDDLQKNLEQEMGQRDFYRKKYLQSVSGEENQLLKENLEATEKMYQGALALLTGKEEKLEIATKALEIYANFKLLFNGEEVPSNQHYAIEALKQLNQTKTNNENPNL